MDNIHQFKNSSLPGDTIHEYDPLLDSSKMTSDHWLLIARGIAASRDD